MEIRPVGVQDLSALLAFSDRFNRVGSSTFAPGFFHWQFEQAAAMIGASDSGVLAAFGGDGQVVGYCAGQRLDALWQGTRVPGYALHEWFVDPQASGVGLILLKEATRDAVFTSVAGGSVDTMSVFLRLSPSVLWFELSRVAAILDPVVAASLLPGDEDRRSLAILRSIAPRLAAIPAADVRYLDRFGAETDEAWAVMRENVLLSADHGATAMNWRYADHPIFEYRRAQVESSKGSAVFVWRIEPVQGAKQACSVARLCEAIGAPAAIAAAIPAILKECAHAGAAFCDFFGTHAATVDALVAGGMAPVVTTPYCDLPRLFSPLHHDMRRTINAACFVKDAVPEDIRRPHQFYFTKADSTQDRPNP